MIRISVAILTFNEERNIRRCIDSVLAVADEIVVIDSFSSDTTVAICESLGVKVVQHAFGGYIEQKNYAISCCTNQHILSIDADEALSEQLIESIQNVKENWNADGYAMNRLTNYCGSWIYHSGWYPDRKLRLFDRSKAFWGGVNPHDKLEMEPGSITEQLKGDLLHYSYYSVEEHKAQVAKFADIAALAMHKKGLRSDVLKIIYKPIARFMRSYIVKVGFLDGKNGLIIAVQTARGSFLRYSKLLKLQKNK
ncbi:MAG: glycosyltransferase family 2 protein [Bacteroidetes bacterium]|nr:glycosyltransferase family 2 protein [Bacteroidota bacterium]